MQFTSHQKKVQTGELVKKPWGTEEVEYADESGEGLMVKKLTMKKGRMCSVQVHKIKKEVVTWVDGELEVIIIDPKILEVSPSKINRSSIKQAIVGKKVINSVNDVVVITPGTVHYMSAPKGDAVYREVSLGPNETTRIFDPNASERKLENQSN